MKTLLFVPGSRGPAEQRTRRWDGSRPALVSRAVAGPQPGPGREDVALVAGSRAKAALEQLVLATLSESMSWM